MLCLWRPDAFAKSKIIRRGDGSCKEQQQDLFSLVAQDPKHKEFEFSAGHHMHKVEAESCSQELMTNITHRYDWLFDKAALMPDLWTVRV